jgi:uncharacterized protein (DUF2062 family)
MIEVMRDGWIKSAWNGLRQRVSQALRSHLEPGAFGKAVGIGVFIGCLPLIGLHILICVLLARWMRLNQAVTVLAAHISNPLTLPFLLLAELAVGEWIIHGRVASLDAGGVELLSLFTRGWEVVAALVVGSLVLGAALGLSLGIGSLVVWRLRGVRAARAEEGA